MKDECDRRTKSRLRLRLEARISPAGCEDNVL